MFPQIRKNNLLILLFLMGFLITPLLDSEFLTTPVSAHEVEVSGNVAATFHIEPNHNPIAGQRSQAWFALTRSGGQLIPLERCNCSLAVYPEPHEEGSQPLINPPLRAINTENYQGIPGAEITFPRAGNYALEITGSPKNTGDFQPFQLEFKVTVR
jgi:hypothetical protein